MISLRAPKSLITRPFHNELARLSGLFRSSRSIFSPSPTAQIEMAFSALRETSWFCPTTPRAASDTTATAVILFIFYLDRNLRLTSRHYFVTCQVETQRVISCCLICYSKQERLGQCTPSRTAELAPASV